MTKEELEKEAKKFLGGWLIDPEIVKLLVDFAEPREKRIEELKKEVERITVAYNNCVRDNYYKTSELETEIALKDEGMGCIETDFNTFKSKAKEIIKELIRVEYADFTNGDYSNELSKVLEQAEQFLKEE